MSNLQCEPVSSSAQPSRRQQRPDRSPQRTFLRAISRGLCYLVVLVPIIVFIASLLGRQFWICEVICNFRAYILVGLIATAPLLLTLKRKVMTFAWIVATLWAMMGTVSVFLPASQPALVSENAAIIKVMSFNVLGSNQQHDAVIAEIRHHDPDVLVVVEYANLWHPALRRIHEEYPYRIEEARWHGFGIGIFSKLPIVKKTVSPTAKDIFDSPLAVATVEVAGRQLRIAGVHLLSPRDQNRLDIRNRQIREVGHLLSADSLPTIVAGDFNCVPWSPFLSDFLARTQYRDSRQGFGYDGTWNANRNFLSIPIDHAFVSPEVHVHNRTVGQSSGSDHFPVIVEVSLE